MTEVKVEEKKEEVKAPEITGEFIMITSDGKEVKARFEVMAKYSKVIKNFYADTKLDVKMPLEKINSVSAELFVKFYDQYKAKMPAKVEKPLRTPKLETVIKDEWLCKFLVEMPLPVQKDLIMACGFLDLEDLRELVACAIASRILGKTTEEYRKEFGVVNDFTPEEEKELARFFAWLDHVFPIS